MKTIIFSIATTLIFLSNSVFGFDKEVRPNALENTNLLINRYINTVVKGDVQDVSQLFSKEFKYENGNKTYSKTSLVNYLKSQKGIQMDCKSSSKIMEITDKYAIAKVSFVFDNFTRTDYLTFSPNEKGEWAIKKIESTYL